MRKRITLIEVLKETGEPPELLFWQKYALQSLIAFYIRKHRLEPIKGSGEYFPGVAWEYWQICPFRSTNEEEDEIREHFLKCMDQKYYLEYPGDYIDDREAISAVQHFLLYPDNIVMSTRERCCDIWGDADALRPEGKGYRVLKNLKLLDNCQKRFQFCPTPKVSWWYTKEKNGKKTVLLLESKDTYCSVRHHLISGNDKVFGVNVDTVIWVKGADDPNGQRLPDSFPKEILDKNNTYLYCGDLDYFGVNALKAYRENSGLDVRPFVPMYRRMVVKSRKHVLKDTRFTGKRRPRRYYLTEIGPFLECFKDEDPREEIQTILMTGKRVTQEFVNLSDYSVENRKMAENHLVTKQKELAGITADKKSVDTEKA